MLEYKVSVDARVMVRLLDASGDPVTGVVFGDVTATVLKSDGTTAVITVDGTNWAEVGAGAFSNQGVYTLTLPASAVNLTGVLSYAVAEAGSKTYVGVVKIVANEEADTYALVNGGVTLANTDHTISSLTVDNGVTIDGGLNEDALQISGTGVSGRGVVLLGSVALDIVGTNYGTQISSSQGTPLNIYSQQNDFNAVTIMAAGGPNASGVSIQGGGIGVNIWSNDPTGKALEIYGDAQALRVLSTANGAETLATLAKQDDILAGVAAAEAKVDTVLKYTEGRWKIHTSGPDANRLVIYDVDGTTPLKKFDLKDAVGDPTIINPFERAPV